jgi:acetate kinase
VLEGIDAIVFSGGIGENAYAVREAVLAPMGWMGIVIDHDRNRCNGTVISSDSSAVRLLVIPTNEELMIARHTATIARSNSKAVEDAKEVLKN